MFKKILLVILVLFTLTSCSSSSSEASEATGKINLSSVASKATSSKIIEYDYSDELYDEDNIVAPNTKYYNADCNTMPNKMYVKQGGIDVLNGRAGSCVESGGENESFNYCQAEYYIRRMFYSDAYALVKNESGYNQYPYPFSEDTYSENGCSTDMEQFYYILSSKKCIGGSERIITIVLNAASSSTYTGTSSDSGRVDYLCIYLDSAKILEYDSSSGFKASYYNTHPYVLGYDATLRYSDNSHNNYLYVIPIANFNRNFNLTKVRNRENISGQFLKFNVDQNIDEYIAKNSNFGTESSPDCDYISNFISYYLDCFDFLFTSMIDFRVTNMKAPVINCNLVDDTLNIGDNIKLTENDILSNFDIIDNGSITITLSLVRYEYSSELDEDIEISYFDDPKVGEYYGCVYAQDDDDNQSYYEFTMYVKNMEGPKITWDAFYIIELTEGQVLSKDEIKAFLLKTNQLN